MRRGSNSDDAPIGCIMAGIIGIVAMPITGIILLCNKDPAMKIIGGILVVIGLIVYCEAFN